MSKVALQENGLPIHGNGVDERCLSKMTSLMIFGYAISIEVRRHIRRNSESQLSFKIDSNEVRSSKLRVFTLWAANENEFGIRKILATVFDSIRCLA